MAYFKFQGKSVFYEEYGKGKTLLFLHGNTASSRMFELLMPLYAERFHCILIDFLGNGRSDRIEIVSPDMWYEQGRQAIALVEHLRCEKSCLIGTSGGAWAAMNAALERPDLFCAVIADSFDGRTLHDQFAENLVLERKKAKEDLQSRQFYAWCQGEDWKIVVERDTNALLQCAKEKRPLFRKPLTELSIPVLFMGSKQDEMCRKDLEQEYEEMASMLLTSEIHIFKQGSHPAILSNAEQAAEVITKFLIKK